jgi:hypothetical protein
MIKTALIRLIQPVSYSSSAQLNIYTAFRPLANKALVRIGPGPQKRFAILLLHQFAKEIGSFELDLSILEMFNTFI